MYKLIYFINLIFKQYDYSRVFALDQKSRSLLVDGVVILVFLISARYRHKAEVSQPFSWQHWHLSLKSLMYKVARQ